MKKIILLLGNTSSGKSFLGKNLEMKYGLPYLSFGDIKRDEINRGSTLGLRLQSDIDNNLPINPNDGLLLINQNLTLIKKLVILLSGYPISEMEYSQISLLYSVILGVYFRADEAIIRKRFFTRGVCPTCNFPGLMKSTCPVHNSNMIRREDVTEEELGKRIRLFNNRIYPFIDLIIKKSLFPVKTYDSGSFSLEDVFSDINQYLNELKTVKK